VERTVSGVGVLDKSVTVLDAIAGADAPMALGDLVDTTGLSRATAHRLAVALEVHGLLRRDGEGRFAPGLRLVGLGRAAADRWPLSATAGPALEWLREATGESVQLYVREGQHRLCVASLDSPNELRTIVEVGARLPLAVGSAGRVLDDASSARRPWVDSVEERARGVASVSAAVRSADAAVLAAVSVSGPVDRTGRHPGRRYGAQVAEAARRIERAASLTR
jgi:DNA-binding IclR family transcriptional regulator